MNKENCALKLVDEIIQFFVLSSSLYPPHSFITLYFFTYESNFYTKLYNFKTKTLNSEKPRCEFAYFKNGAVG